jgi:tRNA threonylcarbamoyladenosine biosynthesis protein TsaE
MEKITHNQAETQAIGKKIASTLLSGDIICLDGDLGSGKTTLVQGIAEALGVTGEITSPTFTLMNVYDITTLKHESIKTFVHIDTYRLKNEQELIDIGAEDYIGQPGVVSIIEWPEKITNFLTDKKVTTITLEHLGSDERKIKIESDQL